LRHPLLALDSKRREAELADIIRATARMPLAIVLAARRLTDPGESLSSTIHRASRDLLDLCEDPRLTHVPERLRSVRASLELSYERLSETARTLFARTSFFPDGISRSFEPFAGILGEDWQQLIQNEVTDFALARYDRDDDRYALLHPVLAFAREKLNEGEGNAFRVKVVELWTAVAAACVPLLTPSQIDSETIARMNLPDDPKAREEAERR